MDDQEKGTRPGVHHTVSNESFVDRTYSSRMSSVSELSEASPTTRLAVHDSDPFGEGRRSGRLQEASIARFPADSVDASHVRLSPAAQQEQELFDRVSPRLSNSPRRSPSLPPLSFMPLAWGSTEYTPIPAARALRSPTGLAGRLRSLRVSASNRMSKHHSIAEEGEEMESGLVGGAYDIGSGGAAYAMVDERIDEDAEDTYGVDLTSFAGPSGSIDQNTLQKYRTLERKGTLTGGLGAGYKPDVRITSKELIAAVTSPTSPTAVLSRRKTVFRRPSGVKEIAQAEANRRGQVIEVVVEEGGTPPMERLNSDASRESRDMDEMHSAAFDLSSYGADHSKFGFDTGEQSESAVHAPKASQPQKRVETYYPTANWKPFTMRWPYLGALIAISILLSVVQENMYQRSESHLRRVPKEGLFTFNNPEDVSTWDYFCFKYLPIMFAVTYGILWQLTDFEVKRLEAYFQLSKEGGALAAESINVDYVTVFNFFRPVQAVRFKHWAVAISSFATLMAVSLVPVLQAASLVLQPDKADRLAHPEEPKYIVISGPWSRFLSAVLIINAFLGIALLAMLQLRHSGLMTDVKGIAGIAAMATKSHILMDFKDLDTVPPQDIHDKLKNHRYILRNSSLAPDESMALTSQEKDKYDAYHLSPNPHPFMLRLRAGIPLVSLTAFFLMFLIIVLWTRLSIITDKAPWFLTLCSVGIKIAYQTLELDLRMMEPFYRLYCRHASPKVLTLDYTGMAFGMLPWRALKNGDWLVLLVGVGSVLAEILTVCVTSFAGVRGEDFVAVKNGTLEISGTLATALLQRENALRNGEHRSGEETLLSFWMSFSLSVAILIYLIITALATYHLRRRPFLPRQPSTIASVLAFIHQSKMLWDFVSNEEDANADDGIFGGLQKTGRHDLDNDMMVKRLVLKGKTYGLGWFTGRDGETHCGIDEEELRASYVHSKREDVRLGTVNFRSVEAHGNMY